MEKDYDIAIIGCGPAGCSLVDNLDNKHKVLMIDKNRVPHYKVCGGLLTEESVNFLNKQNLKIPFHVFSQPYKLKKEYIDLDNNKTVTKGYVLNIDRFNFNRWLSNRVKKKVDILERTELKDISLSNKNIKLTLEDRLNNKKNVSCKYLVGADGVYSKVRRYLNAEPTTKYVAVQDFGELDKPLDKFMLFFSNNLTNYYSWAIPKRNQVITGLAHPSKFKTNSEKVKNVAEEKLKTRIKFIRKEGYSITRPKSEKEICLGDKNNILLIGEAAGWISPSSGDGMSFALRSGYNCAQAFDKSKDVLSAYKENSKELLNEFIDKLKKSKSMSSPDRRKKIF